MITYRLGVVDRFDVSVDEVLRTSKSVFRDATEKTEPSTHLSSASEHVNHDILSRVSLSAVS